jgi:hypothetical protein
MNFFITAPIALIYAYSSEDSYKQNHYFIITFDGTDEIRNGERKNSLNLAIAQVLGINYTIINIAKAQKVLKDTIGESPVMIEQQLISILLKTRPTDKPFELNILAYASDFLLAYSRLPKWPISLRSIWYSKKFRKSFSKIGVSNFYLPYFQSQFNKFAGKKVVTIGMDRFYNSCKKLLESEKFYELRVNLRLNTNENRVFVNLHDRALTKYEISDLKRMVDSIEISTNRICRVILKLHPVCKISHFDLKKFRDELYQLGFNISELENSSDFPFIPLELLLATNKLENYYFGPLTGGVLFMNPAYCEFILPLDNKQKRLLLVSYSQFLRRWLSHGLLLNYSKLLK